MFRLQGSWLLLLLLLVSISQAAGQLTFPPTQETAPYRTALLPASTHWMNVDGPSSLIGTVAMQPAVFGTHFPTSGTNNGLPSYKAELVLPNSLDGVQACDGNLTSVDDFGQSFAGKLILIKRGRCAFGLKALAVQAAGAAGMVLYGCSPLAPTLCSPELATCSSTQPADIPVVFIQSADGQLIATYLASRVAAQTANGGLTPSAALFPPVTIELVSTGALVASERSALSTVIAATSMDQDTVASNNGGLRPWNAANIGDATKDPCLNRMAGVWCENGHIVEVQLSALNFMANDASKQFPSGLGGLSKLRVLSIDNNLFAGPIPQDFCSFTSMLALSIQQQNTGNLDGFTSVPSCLSALTSMHTLQINNNAITSVPDFGNNAKLQYFYVQNNRISTLPSSFSTWTLLRLFDVSANLLTTMPSVGAFTHLSSMLMNDNQIADMLTPTSFDNLPALTKVDLSRNAFTGVLPNFKNSTGLTSLLASSNQLAGSIPTGWATTMVALVTLNAAHNSLTSPCSALGGLEALVSIDLSHNLLTASTGIASQEGDVGSFLTTMIGPSVATVKLDYNKLSGFWIAGWLALAPALTTLTFSHNLVNRLPIDLFTLPITTLDASYNDLSIWGEADSPAAAFLYLNLQGNPKLTADTLPAWVVVNSEMVTAPGASYQCPVLSSTASIVMKFVVDPSFIKYQGCQCNKGTFGVPPLCYTVPLTSTLYSEGGFASGEVGSEFQSVVASTANRTILSDYDPSTASSIKDVSFSDAWFGNDRLTLGISTNFFIDVRNMTNITSDASGSEVSVSKPFVAPIRHVVVRIHLSRSLFAKDTDTLSIYEGQGQSGTRVSHLSGTDTLPTASSSAYTETAEYQALYGAKLAALGSNPALWETTVLTNQATVYFSSRDVGGTHFFATYESRVDCPATYFYDNDVARCRPPLVDYEVSPGIRSAVFAAGSLSAAFVIAMIVVVVWQWESQIIRASSRSFMLLLLILLLVMSVGSFLYAAIPSETDLGRAICAGRAWLSAIPLTGILAILLAKTNRIQDIFGSQKLQVRKRPDSELWFTIAGMVSIMAVFLAVYSGMPLNAPQVAEGSSNLAGNSVASCHNRDGFTIWIGLVLAYIFSMMIFAAYLAFKTRDLPSRFNESGHIANALFLLLFFAVLIVPLDFSVQNSPDSSVLIQGVGQSLMAILLAAVIFLPKVYLIFTVKENSDGKTMMTQKSVLSGEGEDNLTSSVDNRHKSKVPSARTAFGPPSSQLPPHSSAHHPSKEHNSTGHQVNDRTSAASSVNAPSRLPRQGSNNNFLRASGTTQLFSLPPNAVRNYDARTSVKEQSVTQTNQHAQNNNGIVSIVASPILSANVYAVAPDSPVHAERGEVFLPGSPDREPSPEPLKKEGSGTRSKKNEVIEFDGSIVEPIKESAPFLVASTAEPTNRHGSDSGSSGSVAPIS